MQPRVLIARNRTLFRFFAFCSRCNETRYGDYRQRGVVTLTRETIIPADEIHNGNWICCIFSIFF